MLLSRSLRYSFSFNIVTAFQGIKNALKAPYRFLKTNFEPEGIYNSAYINTTAEAVDDVSTEWQAHVVQNPYDLHVMNYFESVQLTNFGTVDNPCVVFSADAPFRFVGCSGPQCEDDYEGHELMWFMLREGPLQRCMLCGQVFKLVRLRDEYSR